ncbi:MAG: amino acid ABC transporter substrate-binding protein, partial [Thermodesulfobacteriota bacterium]
LLGPYSSGLTGSIMPLLEENSFPLLASGAASDNLWQQGYRYLFGIFSPASRYAVGFLEMIAMKDMTRLAIVSADDSFSTVMAAGTKKWAERFGLEVIMKLGFKKGTRDLTAIAQKLAPAKVDALVVCGHFNEALDMRLALKKTNYQPKAYFASIGPAMQKYRDMLGEDAELSFSSSQWEPSLTYRPEDKKVFLLPFREKYGVEPSYHAADAFAAGQILAAAVEKAGTLDRKKIRDTLSSMNYVSIIGRYGVDKTGLQTRHFPINIQWQQGTKKIVWPEELSTAQPQFSSPVPAAK